MEGCGVMFFWVCTFTLRQGRNSVSGFPSLGMDER